MKLTIRLINTGHRYSILSIITATIQNQTVHHNDMKAEKNGGRVHIGKSA